MDKAKPFFVVGVLLRHLPIHIVQRVFFSFFFGRRVRFFNPPAEGSLLQRFVQDEAQRRVFEGGI